MRTENVKKVPSGALRNPPNSDPHKHHVPVTTPDAWSVTMRAERYFNLMLPQTSVRAIDLDQSNLADGQKSCSRCKPRPVRRAMADLQTRPAAHFDRISRMCGLIKIINKVGKEPRSLNH